MPAEEMSKIKNEEQLYHEALEEFAAHSYETASINEILKRSKVSKGSFYHHFEDKKQLYLSVLDQVAEVQAAFAQKRFQEIRPIGRLDFFILLKVQGRLIMDFTQIHPTQAAFLRRVRMEGTAMQDVIGQRYAVEGIDYYEHMIEQAIARGELRRDVPVELMGRLINHIMVNLQDFTSSRPAIGMPDDSGFINQLDYLLSILRSGMRR